MADLADPMTKRRFTVSDIDVVDGYKLATGLIVPRPIGWIGTTSAGGVDAVDAQDTVVLADLLGEHVDVAVAQVLVRLSVVVVDTNRMNVVVFADLRRHRLGLLDIDAVVGASLDDVLLGR